MTKRTRAYEDTATGIGVGDDGRGEGPGRRTSVSFRDTRLGSNLNLLPPDAATLFLHCLHNPIWIGATARRKPGRGGYEGEVAVFFHP